MQLNALDWVIAEEAKRPRDFKNEEIKHLQRVRKELLQSGKPLPVQAPGSYEGFRPVHD
jgi:hypothetical protein